MEDFRLIDIMQPFYKACLEAYIGDYIHHFRLTTSRIQRIIIFISNLEIIKTLEFIFISKNISN